MKEWGKAQLFVVVGSGSGMSREGAKKQYECVGNHQANGAGERQGSGRRACVTCNTEEQNKVMDGAMLKGV